MIDDCRVAIQKGFKSVLLQLPTGGGKSIIAAEFIKRSLNKGRKAAFIVPRRELIKQMGKTFRDFEIPYSYVCAGKSLNPWASVHLCTIGSLVRRVDKISPDIVFFDETHWGSNQLDKIIKHYKSKGCYIIGLSATPKKTNGSGLDKWYDTMVCGPSIRWLIDNEYLSDYKIFAPSKPDLSGVKVVNGEYSKIQLSEVMEQDKYLIGDAVKQYKNHAMGKLNIVFCTSRKHSEEVCLAFNNANIPAMSIDGETPDVERTRIIKMFAKREILVLTSVDLLTTGFDLAMNSGMDVTVECMSDLRPTKSLALQMQKFGRTLRKKPFPAIILDHASNTSNFGLPCNEREWSLKSETKSKRGSSEKTMPVKQCAICFFCENPKPICSNCGHVHEIKYREIEEMEGELTEIEKQAVLIEKKEKRMEVGKAKSKADLERIATERGYQKGWIFNQMKLKKIKS